MSTKAIEWRINYRAVFGAITDQQADAWERYAAENLDGLESDAMNNAIAVLCDNWPTDINRRPGVKDVCRIIREQRLRKRGIATEKPFEVRQAESVLRANPDNGTLYRWGVVCDSMDKGDSMTRGLWAAHLERYAIAHGGLTAPYWSDTVSRRSAGCLIMDRQTYGVSLPPDDRDILDRMTGMSFARLAESKRFVMDEEPTEHLP